MGLLQILASNSIARQVDVRETINGWGNLSAPQKFDVTVSEQIISATVPRPESTIAQKFFVIT